MERIEMVRAFNLCINQGIKYRMFVDLSGKRRIGHVLSFNAKTLWVKVMQGARTYIVVKRHYIKHRVRWHLDPSWKENHETIRPPSRNQVETDKDLEL